jgi:hypothetical protein
MTVGIKRTKLTSINLVQQNRLPSTSCAHPSDRDSLHRDSAQRFSSGQEGITDDNSTWLRGSESVRFVKSCPLEKLERRLEQPLRLELEQQVLLRKKIW